VDEIQVQVTAVHTACGRLTGQQVQALHRSVEQTCRMPAGFGWDRKAAAHAEIFNLLADAAGDPVLTRVLGWGAGFAHDLMIAAGPAANGMTRESRSRLLACLHAGDTDGAAREMENHLRVLHFMRRLATPSPQRASA
jgi:DNA-binding FadR family transcriptional regulator